VKSNELGRLLGTGKEAEVYEHGELALKLYKTTASKSSTFREAAILAIVESSALPKRRFLWPEANFPHFIIPFG
jgi:serine/threonine-protein kinase RIO1